MLLHEVLFCSNKLVWDAVFMTHRAPMTDRQEILRFAQNDSAG